MDNKVRFINNAYYNHKSCLDTHIYVIKVSFRCSEYTKLRVHFVNKKHSGIFETSASIKILKKDYERWSQVV